MRIQRLAASRKDAVRKRLLLHQSRSGGFVAASLDAAMPLTGAGQAAVEDERSGVDTSGVRSAARVFLTALALGWSADFLFYGKSLGVSVPIFTALLLAALFTLTRLSGVRTVPTNLWLIAPIAFFSVMVFVRANAMLTFLNVVALLVLLSLLVFFLAGGRIERLGLLGYPAVAARVGLRSLIEAIYGLQTVGSIAGRRRSRGVRIALPVLRGIVVALPILIIFGALLASADQVFRQFLTDLFQLKSFEDLPETMTHLLLILVVAWVVAGGLLIAISRGRMRSTESTQADALPGTLANRPRFGFVEGATILVMVNLLFAVFAWIQFANIFFGQPTNMPFEEYRNYVRQGFGEVLMVCVLTIALILGVRLFARLESPRQGVLLQLLSTFMVVLVFVMLVSAYWRMDAWEEVQFYINTQVRIYVRAFIVWLGIVFGWLTITMWFRRDRFAIGAFVAALGFLVTINLANPDADVAAYNLKRNDELSIRYLNLLSDDAVPVLVAGLEQTDDEVIRASLRYELLHRFLILDSDLNRHKWQSFHLARSQAYEMLSELQRAGKLAVSP
ncbi:MAG TPA: DUF4173 domain-containing protein [Chloroflexia bacterium]|nr:DUF4173 domain-containing protein [Chloroflexia bacterium]